MEQTSRFKIKRISLVLLANAGLSGAFLAIGALTTGGGIVLWLFFVLQTVILFRMMNCYGLEKGWAIFLSILLTVTGWVACFLLVASGTRMVC